MGEARNGAHYLKPTIGGTIFTKIDAKKATLWHQRLGYPSFGSLSSLLASYGLQLNKEKLSCCDICHRAKQTRCPFTIINNKAETLFSLIHCDLRGRYLHLVVVITFFALSRILVGLYGYSFLKIKLRPTIG